MYQVTIVLASLFQVSFIDIYLEDNVIKVEVNGIVIETTVVSNTVVVVCVRLCVCVDMTNAC